MSSSSVETRPLLLRSRTLLFAAAIAATLFQAIVQPAHASSSTTVTTVNQPLTLQAEVKLQFYLQDQQFGVHDSQLDSWVPSDDYYFGITLRNYFLSAMEAGLKTVLGNAQDAGVQPYGGSTAVPVVEITDIHRVLNVPSTSRLLLTSGRGTEKRQNNYASAAAVATTSKRGRAGRKNKRLLDHRSSRNRDRKPWWWWMENGDEDEDGSSTWDEDERDRDEEENEDDTNQRSDEQQGTIPESRNNDDNSNSWNNNGNAEGSSVDDQEFDPNWWHDNENRNVAPTTQAPPRPAPQPAAAPPMLSPAPAPGTNTAAPGSTSSGTPNVVATQDEPVVVSSTATPGASAADLSVSDVVLRIHYLADPSTSYTAQNQYQVEELRKHLKLIFTTDSARIWLKDEMEYSLRTMAVESAVLRKSNLVFSPGMKVLSVSMPGVENGEWHDLASSPTLTVAGNNAAPGGNTNNNNNAEVLRHRPGTTSTGSTTGGASQPSEPAYDFNPDLYPQAGIIGSASGMNNGGGRSSPTSAEMEEPGEEEPLDEQLDLLWVVIFIATGWIFIFGFWTVCCSGSGPCGDSLQSSFYKDAMNNKITPDSNDIIVGIPTDGNPNIAHGQPVANTSRGPDATVGQPVMAGRAAGQQPVVIDTGAPAAVAARAPTQNLHPPGGSTTTTGTGTAGHNQQANHQQPMLNKLNPCSACLESTIGVFTFVFESVKGFCNTVMVLFCCIPFHAGLRCLAGVKSSFVSCFGMVVANMFSGWKNGGRNNNKRGSTSGGNHSPQASKVDQNLIPKLYKPYFRQLREQISRHLEAEKRNFTLQSRLLEQAAASGPTSASAVESTTTSPSEGSGTGTTTTTATTAGGETKINAGGAEQTNSTAPKQLHFIIPTDKFLEQVQNKVNPLEKRKIFEQRIKMTSRDKKFDDKELQDLNNALEYQMQKCLGLLEKWNL
ncbi:unnamed protein product [Amoebophrya sp. A120]|nr:unnamed protein product [Amoebophrya sp. A120]|eukprot:GSA120T00007149001.1